MLIASIDMSNNASDEPDYRRHYFEDRNRLLGKYIYIMVWLWRNEAECAFLDAEVLADYFFHDRNVHTQPLCWVKEDLSGIFSVTEKNYKNSTRCDLYVFRGSLPKDPGSPEELADTGVRVLVFEIPDDNTMRTVIDEFLLHSIIPETLPRMDTVVEIRNDNLRKRW